MENVSSRCGNRDNAPRLRFPEFSGEWLSTTLGAIGTFTKGAPLSKADIASEGTPFILYGELYTTYKEVTTEIKRRTLKTANDECMSRVEDVIIPTSGETPDEIATATCIMVSNVILAGDLNIYRNSTIDGRFISYIINHVINGDISRIAQGKSVVHIKASELAKLRINYPSRQEQNKIIDFLMLLNRKIAKQQSLINALKTYKRGLLCTLLSEISESVPLASISEYHSSNNTMATIEQHNIGKYPVYDAGGIITSIDNYDFAFDYVAIIKDGSGVGRLRLCQAQSSIIGTLGAIKPRGCSVGYLYAVLQGIDFRQFATGMAIPHIYYKDYKNTLVPFPDSVVQNKIKTILSKIDTLITSETRMLELLQTAKTNLLHRMFI